jgi:hypothetical protein
MEYRKLLEEVRKEGCDQIYRQQVGHCDLSGIGRKGKGQVFFPHAPPCKLIVLEDGDETDLDDEVVDSVFRWIHSPESWPQ